jgi:hypothetical protein
LSAAESDVAERLSMLLLRLADMPATSAVALQLRDEAISAIGVLFTLLYPTPRQQGVVIVAAAAERTRRPLLVELLQRVAADRTGSLCDSLLPHAASMDSTPAAALLALIPTATADETLASALTVAVGRLVLDAASDGSTGGVAAFSWLVQQVLLLCTAAAVQARTVPAARVVSALRLSPAAQLIPLLGAAIVASGARATVCEAHLSQMVSLVGALHELATSVQACLDHDMLHVTLLQYSVPVRSYVPCWCVGSSMRCLSLGIITVGCTLSHGRWMH